MAIDPFVAEHDEQLALLVSELTDRVQRGDAVDLEAECRQHPALANDLRELWGVIVVARPPGAIRHWRRRRSRGRMTFPAILFSFRRGLATMSCGRNWVAVAWALFIGPPSRAWGAKSP